MEPADSEEALESLVAEIGAHLEDCSDPRDAFRLCLSNLPASAKGEAWRDGRDVLGEAYQRILAASERRGAGQFFTPLWIARAMAHWLLTEPTKTVLDPGCGSGSLLIGCAHERREPKTTLLGIDSDPLVIETAAVTRSIRSIERMELRCADFLLDPIGELPDAVICNPPFTRHHDIDPQLKEAVHAGFEKRLGLRLSRLASLHVLFLIRALEVSSPEARLAFITPSHWLEMDYGRAVKRFLLEQGRVEAIVRFPAQQLLFPGVRTTAAITLIRKGASGGPARLLECDGLAASRDFIASGLDRRGAGRDLRLEAGTPWTSQRARRSKGVALGELAEVHRGVATGYNSFFVLSEEQRREFGLGRGSMRHCLSSPRHLAVDEIRPEGLEGMPDQVPRWLLSPKRLRSGGPLRRYLDWGENDLQVTERHLVAARLRAGRRWFEVEVPARAPILFSYFNRPAARFVRNHAEAVPLNSWLVIVPHDGVDADALFAVLRAQGMDARLRERARVYGRGLWKLEPSQLLDVRLPAAAVELRGLEAFVNSTGG